MNILQALNAQILGDYVVNMDRINESTLILARQVANHLANITGITSIALGGSLARGITHDNSDIDLGIYYHPERPPSLKALRQLAAQL